MMDASVSYPMATPRSIALTTLVPGRICLRNGFGQAPLRYSSRPDYTACDIPKSFSYSYRKPIPCWSSRPLLLPSGSLSRGTSLDRARWCDYVHLRTRMPLWALRSISSVVHLDVSPSIKVGKLE